ncbi:Uncharacterised protein [Klebsiella pneumoniae]|nr:Uncharacterised protein [Klebsiella pneumoniae]
MAPRINLTQPIAQYRDSFTLRRQRAAVRDPSMPNASPLVMVIPLCASVSLNSFPQRAPYQECERLPITASCAL